MRKGRLPLRYQVVFITLTLHMEVEPSVHSLGGTCHQTAHIPAHLTTLRFTSGLPLLINHFLILALPFVLISMPKFVFQIGQWHSNGLACFSVLC